MAFLKPDEIGQEVVRWAIPLACAFVFGQSKQVWTKWNKLDPTLKALADAVTASKSELTEQISILSNTFTREITTLETRMNQKFEALDSGLHKLKTRTGIIVQRQEIKLTRQQERLVTLLTLIAPEQAEAIQAAWANEDAQDRLMQRRQMDTEEELSLFLHRAERD